MLTIVGESISTFFEKKSEFIGHIKNINTEQEAKEYIEEIKKKHSQATHNVWVYRINTEFGEITKYSDDGEPQNTAGKPCYEILKMLDISNVAVVITRYFGGIKLGAGGLIRAYAKSTKISIEQAQKIELIKTYKYLISASYDKQSRLEKFLLDENIEILEKSYTDMIFYNVRLSNDQVLKFNDLGIETIQIGE